MRKILSLMVCLLATFTAAQAVSTRNCILQHKGTVRHFDADQITSAIAAAVDGDTLFLTVGEFPGFTIDKKITVKGAGQQTMIKGDVLISISGTPTLTQTLLEGVNLNTYEKDIRLQSAMKGVKIKHCSMNEFITNAANSDIVIDRCNISYELYLSTNIKSMTVINSNAQIGRYGSSSSNVIDFINCNVCFFYCNYVAGTFINCAITRYMSSNTISHCSFDHCLFKWDAAINFDKTTIAQQCYYDDSCEWSAASFESLGYMGNDGRVVGYTGGATPYTLDPVVPKVTQSQISLDPATRVLNVNLKVSAK